jgi:hypothetical protein
VEFERMVRQTGSEKGAKGFSSWGHFVARLFCHLGQAHSLREICNGLGSCFGKLRHLGISGSPKRSTLAYANEHRPWELFQGIFYELLGRCQREFQTTGRRFRFKNKLMSFDATWIELCSAVFDWARFRRTKGAVKLHLLLDHSGYLPEYAHITEGRIHEVNVLKRLQLSPGTLVAIDRGCVDYELFGRWTAEGVFFVTRLKGNASFRLTKSLPVPQNRNILRDELIRPEGFYAGQDCPHVLRRIVVLDREKDEVIELLTNHLDFGATTIAAIYKERWQIELFFKALKQYLRIKTFVGTTANALKIQIWTALIAILILKYLKVRSTFGWSLSNLVAILRLNLFTYRNLWEWINRPMQTPPLEPETQQLSLRWI